MSRNRSLLLLLTTASLAGAGCGPSGKILRFANLFGCPSEPASGFDGLPEGATQVDLRCVLTTSRELKEPTADQALAASRAASFLSAGESNNDKAGELALEGKRLAERALALRPDDPAAHYLLAMNEGQILQLYPLNASKSLSVVETQLKAAVEESPGLDMGGPLRVLGMLYVKAPAWPLGPGDTEAGLELLQRAAKDYPEHPLNHAFLAQAVFKEEGPSARTKVAALVKAARKALTTRNWGWPSLRWNREIDDLAQEAWVDGGR